MNTHVPQRLFVGYRARRAWREIERMDRDGYGWEDICVKMGISHDQLEDKRAVRAYVLRRSRL